MTLQTVTSQKTLRIGCASAFWGDTGAAAHQLVNSGELDYLVFDYLAEMTMSIMAGAQMKNPEAGFASDFIGTLKPLLRRIKAQGIKVCSNAGGVNASGCAKTLAQVVAASGVDLTIAVVEGDNLAAQQHSLQQSSITEMFSGEVMPDNLISVNAYLGAPSIAAALAAGADIVITGRVVDSAVVVGPLVHEFNWSWQDYDKLAQASLAGHVIECGTQATGGNFTDWHLVRDGYANMGFPIVECSADGSFVVTKCANTGGLVSVHTVGEQILYEIGDPKAYLLPDVTCDFSQVALKQLADNRVQVSGATGRACSKQYKVSATYLDGYRTTATFMIGGIDAAHKGQIVADAIITRVSSLYALKGINDFDEVNIEVLGSESTYGVQAKAQQAREVVVKIAVSHQDKRALGVFGSEIAQAATAMAPGITGLVGGRPKASPRICLFSFLLNKDAVAVSYRLVNSSANTSDESSHVVEVGSGQSLEPSDNSWQEHALENTEATIAVPLVELALARSGDKGNHCNIGVIARDNRYLPYIEAALTRHVIGQFFAHMLSDSSEVSRYQLPNMDSLNILMTNCLGGGGMASLRIDPQGKAVAQQLLSMPITINHQTYNQVKGT